MLRGIGITVDAGLREIVSEEGGSGGTSNHALASGCIGVVEVG